MYKLLIILLFAFSSNVMLGSTEGPSDKFSSANDLYNEANYDSAFTLYESLITEGNLSFELFFNAGNAAYQLQKNGPTILYFEKAKKLDPGNVDIQHNLLIAHKSLIDKVDLEESSKASERIMAILSRSPNYWGWGAIVLCFASMALFTLYKISSTRRNKLIGFVLGLTSLILSLIVLVLAIVQTNYVQTHDSGVIMKQSVTLLNAPTEDAESAFILHEGTKAEVKSNANGWFEVIYSDGKIGWVNETEFELI